jgi:hypothetical protein
MAAFGHFEYSNGRDREPRPHTYNGTKPTILTAEALAALEERIKTPPDDGALVGPKIARWLAK